LLQLPLSYLKTGYLSAPPEDDTLAPHSDWKRLWFVLDHEAFYQVKYFCYIFLISIISGTQVLNVN
jgi:hypothetical protein